MFQDKEPKQRPEPKEDINTRIQAEQDPYAYQRLLEQQMQEERRYGQQN